MIADHLSTDKSLSAFVNKTVLLHSVGKYAHKKITRKFTICDRCVSKTRIANDVWLKSSIDLPCYITAHWATSLHYTYREPSTSLSVTKVLT